MGCRARTGKSYVDVFLDGEDVGSCLVDEKSYHLDRVLLPATRLAPGEHVLAIELGRWTTTNYRLASATLAWET